MKKQLYKLGLLAIILVSFGFQNITPDARLIDYLGKEKVEILQKNNPDLIRYYNYFLDNSYMVSTVPQDKIADNSFPELILPLQGTKVDTKKLNVLKLNIQRKYDQRLYFKVKDSHDIFVFLSEKEFMEKYNAYRKANGLIK